MFTLNSRLQKRRQSDCNGTDETDFGASGNENGNTPVKCLQSISAFLMVNYSHVGILIRFI